MEGEGGEIQVPAEEHQGLLATLEANMKHGTNPPLEPSERAGPC